MYIGELPIIVDYTHYDDNGGYHNITVVANSTIGESAVFIDTVLLDRMLISCMLCYNLSVYSLINLKHSLQILNVFS